MTEPLPFSGTATPLSAVALVRAAKALDCEAAVIDAVLRVETGGAGGFLADGSGRPRILFEAHLFARATGGRYNASHPTISSPIWNRALYLGGAAEYDRLAQAVALDRGAALKSTSWGLFQILGQNHVPAGFRAVEYFVSAMATGEDAQLAAFTSFCTSEGLAAYLRARAWAAFARRYNGPQFAENRYADKLELAYQAALKPVPAAKAEVSPNGSRPVLRLGDRGEAVSRLQMVLRRHREPHLLVDGILGRATEEALIRFQTAVGVMPNGIVTPITWAAIERETKL
jgi:hypothetical protein